MSTSTSGIKIKPSRKAISVQAAILVSCLDYSSALKMEAIFPLKHHATFNTLHGILYLKTEFSIYTNVSLLHNQAILITAGLTCFYAIVPRPHFEV
jgi:hypothetical protein